MIQDNLDQTLFQITLEAYRELFNGRIPDLHTFQQENTRLTQTRKIIGNVQFERTLHETAEHKASLATIMLQLSPEFLEKTYKHQGNTLNLVCWSFCIPSQKQMQEIAGKSDNVMDFLSASKVKCFYDDEDSRNFTNDWIRLMLSGELD